MNCSTCRFAAENPRAEQDVRGLRAIDLTQPKTYACRRYPPTFAITAQGSAPMWPNMLGEHWCGEHSEKPPAQYVRTEGGLVVRDPDARTKVA